MPANLLALISNTFIETLRQPVFAIIIGATVLLLIFAPALSMFTLDNDNLLLKDICLSNLLVAGLFLAVFAASSVVTEEIENKTVLTVVSKTVSRPLFIIGKFIGVAGAITLAEYLLCLVVLIVIRHGVMQSNAETHDTVVITLTIISAVLVLLIGLAGNYFYNWRFSSTAVLLASLFTTLMILVLAFIDAKWQYNPAKNNLDWGLLGHFTLSLLAVLILTAVAIMASTRLNLVATLILCLLAFVIGVMVPYWLSPIASQGGVMSYIAKAGLAMVPGINLFVATNSIYDNTAIPLSYIGKTALYAFFYISATLVFAIALFRHRELG